MEKVGQNLKKKFGFYGVANLFFKKWPLTSVLSSVFLEVILNFSFNPGVQYRSH